MKSSELSGTIKIENWQFDYEHDPIDLSALKHFNEQLRRLCDMKVTVTYEVVYSADPTWLSRLYTEIVQKHRHAKQCTKLARALYRRPRHYHVSYHARKISQRRRHELQ